MGSQDRVPDDDDFSSKRAKKFSFWRQLAKRRRKGYLEGLQLSAARSSAGSRRAVSAANLLY